MHDAEQAGFLRPREEINRSSVGIFLSDASLALTFLTIVERGDDPKMVKRNIHIARKAFDSSQRLRPRYLLSDPQEQDLNTRVAEVKVRL